MCHFYPLPHVQVSVIRHVSALSLLRTNCIRHIHGDISVCTDVIGYWKYTNAVNLHATRWVAHTACVLGSY